MNERPLKDLSVDELNGLFRKIQDTGDVISDVVKEVLSNESFIRPFEAAIVRGALMLLIKLCRVYGIPYPSCADQLYGINLVDICDGLDDPIEYDDDAIYVHSQFADFDLEGLSEDIIISEDELKEACGDTSLPESCRKHLESILETFDDNGDYSYYAAEEIHIFRSKRLGKIFNNQSLPKSVSDILASFRDLLGSLNWIYLPDFAYDQITEDGELIIVSSQAQCSESGFINSSYFRILSLRPMAYVIDEVLRRYENGVFDCEYPSEEDAA